MCKVINACEHTCICVLDECMCCEILSVCTVNLSTIFHLGTLCLLMSIHTLFHHPSSTDNSDKLETIPPLHLKETAFTCCSIAAVILTDDNDNYYDDNEDENNNNKNITIII